MIFPLCIKVYGCTSKGNSKCHIHHFACYCFKNVCFPYLSLLANTPSPVTTLNFNLDCYVFQYVEFGIGMSIWYPWFSRLSSGSPFMRSYLNMLNNSRNCFLCYTYMWACVFISTSIFSHMTSVGCVVRKSEWK